MGVLARELSWPRLVGFGGAVEGGEGCGDSAYTVCIIGSPPSRASKLGGVIFFHGQYSARYAGPFLSPGFPYDPVHRQDWPLQRNLPRFFPFPLPGHPGEQLHPLCP